MRSILDRWEACSCTECERRRYEHMREHRMRAAEAMREPNMRSILDSLHEATRKFAEVTGIPAAILPPPEQTVNRIPPVPIANRCVCCGRPIKDGQKVCGRLRCWRPANVFGFPIVDERPDKAVDAMHRQARHNTRDVACKR